MTDDASSASDRAGELIGSPASDPIEVELFVRSLAPFGTRSSMEGLIERLEHLRATGIVDAVQVRVWGDAVRTDGAASRVEPDDGIVQRIVDLFSFAADSRCSIGRYFRVATDGSLVDAESRSRLVPPRRCLAVRRTGDIVAVFPCDVGDDHLTPWDALEYLEDGPTPRQVADVTDT